MKYSQGRQQTLHKSIVSSTKPCIEVGPFNKWGLQRPRQLVGKAYKLLSKDIFAFLKLKNTSKDKNSVVDIGTSASISYLTDKSDNTSYCKESFSDNVCDKDSYESRTLVQMGDRCDPIETAKLSSSLVLTNQPNHTVEFTHMSNKALETRICSSKLIQVLIFLFNDGFNRQFSPRKQLTVSINADHQNCFIAISDSGKGISNSVSTRLSVARGHFENVLELVRNDEQAIDSHVAVLNALMKVGGMFELRNANHFYNLCLITLPLASCEDESKSCMNNILQFIKGRSIEDSRDYLPNSDQDFFINEPKSLFVENFQQILLDNFQNPNFRRTTAASMLAMSEKTLSRRLAHHYSSNFNTIIKYYRLNKAYQLISKGDSVSSVAYGVGFNSASYFTQCFRIKFGFAPSDLTRKYS